MRRRNRLRAVLVLLIVTVVAVVAAGCSRSVDGTPLSVQQANSQGGDQSGNVDTDQYDQLTLECQILRTDQIAKAVGVRAPRPSSSGRTAGGTSTARWRRM